MPHAPSLARVALSASLFALAWAQPGPAAVRIGDPESAPDPSKYDPNYPYMAEWAKAGVTGGIPPRSATPVVKTLKPGDDIQAAINAATAPGVVLLSKGLYSVKALINMKSGIILRGEDPAGTILEYDFGTDAGSGLGRCIAFNKVTKAALEDLTMRNARVYKLDPATYLHKYENNPDFSPGNNATVDINGSTDCWMQGCRNTYSVSRPMHVTGGSKHITLRDNLTDVALNKGDNGAGYYEVVDATYVLVYNEEIHNIRHVCLDATIDYTVLVHCKLGADVNWHCCGSMSKSLVEACPSTAVKEGDQWGTFSRYKDAIAADNYIWRVQPDYDDGNVYHTYWPGLDKAGTPQPPFIFKNDKPAPAHGVLYAVTGQDIQPSTAGARERIGAPAPRAVLYPRGLAWRAPGGGVVDGNGRALPAR